MVCQNLSFPTKFKLFRFVGNQLLYNYFEINGIVRDTGFEYDKVGMFAEKQDFSSKLVRSWRSFSLWSWRFKTLIVLKIAVSLTKLFCQIVFLTKFHFLAFDKPNSGQRKLFIKWEVLSKNFILLVLFRGHGTFLSSVINWRYLLQKIGYQQEFV